MNKKEKSTNTSPYPDEVIDRLARAFYPAILACWNSEEGQREFATWQGNRLIMQTTKNRKFPLGRFCPAGRKARGTGCSNPLFYCPIKSAHNKKSSTS